jgi:hypothetical protein
MEIYCKSHARPAAAAHPRGKRRLDNQLNFRRRKHPICTGKFNLPILVIDGMGMPFLTDYEA